MYHIQSMPIKTHYLQTDLITLDADTAEDARALWERLNAQNCLYKTVKRDGQILQFVDYRSCDTCTDRLEFCQCGHQKPGLVLIDKGLKIDRPKGAWFQALLERVTPRKGATT